MNPSPVCVLSFFYPDTSIFPVIEVHGFEGGCLQEWKTETYSSQRNVIPYFPSIRTQDMFYQPNQKIQASLPLPWFKCFSSSASCLALLYLLRLSKQNKRALQFRISIFETSSVFLTCWDLSCLHLPWPVLGSSPATALTQHTPGVGDSAPQTALSGIGINKASRETHISVFASRHLKKEKKACV